MNFLESTKQMDNDKLKKHALKSLVVIADVIRATEYSPLKAGSLSRLQTVSRVIRKLHQDNEELEERCRYLERDNMKLRIKAMQ